MSSDNPIVELWRAIIQLGVKIQSTWIGEALRSLPNMVVTALMVLLAAGIGVIVLMVKSKSVENEDNKSELLKELFSDDATFGVAYTSALFSVSLFLIGLILWPWLTGNVPFVPILSALGSLIGVWTSIWVERSMRKLDPDAYSGSKKSTIIRAIFMHSACGIILAKIITMIPSTCPYDPDSPVAKLLIMNAMPPPPPPEPAA